MIYFVWVVTIFVIGFVSGYSVRARQGEFSDADLQRLVALLISFVWVVSSVMSLPPEAGHSTPIYLHGLMGLAAGFLFKGEGEVTIPINLGTK